MSHKPWYKNPVILIPILVSVVSAIIAVVSAVGSIDQANIAKDQANIASDQNIVAEQQELVTLVGGITQDPATIAQESEMITNENSLLGAQNGVTTEELVDSEEAATLIHMLHAKGVTATEYYETAVGLESGQSYAQALSFLKSAVALPSDPRTRASALHFEAQIYYQLGQVSEAKQADMLAEQSYDVPDVTPPNRLSNLAYTELFDAFYQASLNCASGQAEVNAAYTTIVQNGLNNDQMASAYNNAEKQLRRHGCKKIPPTHINP